MYDELKAQKIQEMEGLLAEQDGYILKMGEVRLWLYDKQGQALTLSLMHDVACWPACWHAADADIPTTTLMHHTYTCTQAFTRQSTPHSPHSAFHHHVTGWHMCAIQDARQLAEHWRKEAEAQRHAAASAGAPDTARHIKALQDNAVAANEALLERDRMILEVRVIYSKEACCG